MSLQMSLSDLSRILAGLLTGVGFIGAGLIVRDDKGEVHDLTTAAALWATTGVSIAIGVGFIVLGLLLALLVYCVLSWGDWPFSAICCASGGRSRRRKTQKRRMSDGREKQVSE
jgi:uncharacterized membrane protein YhiD involved in acid resistance